MLHRIGNVARKSFCLLALSWGVGLVETAAEPPEKNAAKPAQMPEIVAHRGASDDAPENTLAALELAWEQGADASEFDVRLTRDGRIVTIHDDSLARTAGLPLRIVRTDAAELRRHDVGTWKHPKFAAERIPFLSEMLAAVPAGKRVFIEIKSGPEIVPELVRVLEAAKLPPEQTAVIAFSAAVVDTVKKARPDLKVYWIVSLKRDPLPVAELLTEAKRIAADGVDLSADDLLDAPYAAAIKQAGLELYVWTVNDAARARRMVEIGVDGITTDRPAALRKALSR